MLSELVMRSLEDIEQFRAGYDDEQDGAGAQSSQGGGATNARTSNDIVKTYIRAQDQEEESKQEESKEVGEYIEVYDDGGTMMIKDQDLFK